MDSAGKVIKMEGRVSGSQPLTITWYKDNQEICPSEKYDISFKNNMAVLCIRDSAVSDSSVYTCEASNEAGKASFQVSLTVSGREFIHKLTKNSMAECYVVFSDVSRLTSCWFRLVH